MPQSHTHLHLGQLSEMIRNANLSLRVLCLAGETRVGIFAQRNIAVGEELSYDYRFTHTGQNADAYR